MNRLNGILFKANIYYRGGQYLLAVDVTPRDKR